MLNNIDHLHKRPNSRIRLILHAGTPKTGTTSLQSFLDQNRQALERRGILYPNNYLHPGEPKHQWIVRCFLGNNHDRYRKKIGSVLDLVTAETHTVILSTEGIFNHWWDFSEQAKSELRRLGTWFDVKVLVFFREPVSFAVSLYKQCLLNAAVDAFPCYGRDRGLSETLDDPWFSRHLDYAGFIEACEQLFGKNSVAPMKYEDGDMIISFGRMLDLENELICGERKGDRKNVSLGTVGTEMLRIVNRHMLGPAERGEVLECLRRIDAATTKGADRFPVNESAAKRIQELSARSRSVLAERFGLLW